MTQPIDFLTEWRKNMTTVRVTGVDERQWKLMEHRATIVYVDPSKVILTTIGASPDTETNDLQAVTLTAADGGVVLKFPDGKSTFIY